MGLLITRARSAGTNRPAKSGDTTEPSPQERARALAIAAFAPLVTSYAAVAAVFALVSAIAPHARFSTAGTLLAAGPGMLAVYQVPVTIGGSPLGVLPLLPTIGVCVLVARTAAGAAQRLGYREPGQAFIVVGVMAGTHALTGGLIAVAATGLPLHVMPLAALLIPGVLAGGAALAGVASRCGITVGVRRHLNPVAASGLRAGILALAALLTAGCATFALGTLLSLPTAQQLFATAAPGFGGDLGMLLLSAGYLPNAVIAGTSMTLGPGFSIGSLSVNPFGFTPGAMPGVPLLAGVPESYSGWWPMLFLGPLACGLLVGVAVRHSAERAVVRLRVVLIAGALAALGMVLLATLAGGELGGGPLSPVEVPAALFSLAGFGWIVVPGGIVAWFAGPHPALRLPRREVHTAEPGDADEPETSGDLAEPDPVETWDSARDEEQDEVTDESAATDEEEPVDEEEPADEAVAGHTGHPEERRTQ